MKPGLREHLEGTAYRVPHTPYIVPTSHNRDEWDKDWTWYKGSDKAEPLPAPEGNALKGIIWAALFAVPIWAVIIALFAWLDHC